MNPLDEEGTLDPVGKAERAYRSQRGSERNGGSLSLSKVVYQHQGTSGMFENEELEGSWSLFGRFEDKTT
jgi:hypothetical protein